MKNKKIRLATVFSGIGAIEQALIKEKIPFDIIFACDNGERTLDVSKEEIENIARERNKKPSEIAKEMYSQKGTNWMKKSYFANYKISEEKWHEDIRFIDGNEYKDKVDLFVGGSPCQSFSNMGKRGGFEDTRGTLFFDFARLVKEMQPKVFIYENVPGMLNHDKGNTWITIQNVFDELGYRVTSKILCATEYGVPQNRKRLFVVGFKNKDIQFNMPEPYNLETVAKDFLFEPNDVEAKYYLKEKGFKFVTTNTSRAKVNQDIIRTQKANQQFNWNGDFVFVPYKDIKDNKDIAERAYKGIYQGQEGVTRKMTPRECLRLMGFSDLFKIAVPDVHMYRQSGNSIVVNVLQKIMKEILRVENFDE